MIEIPNTIERYFAMMEAISRSHPFIQHSESQRRFLRMTLNPTPFGFVEMNDFLQAQESLKGPFMVVETPQVSGSENGEQAFRRFQCGFLIVGQQAIAKDSATQAALHSEVETVCSQIVGWIWQRSRAEWYGQIKLELEHYSASPVSGLTDDNMSGYYVDFSYLVVHNPDFYSNIIDIA